MRKTTTTTRTRTTTRALQAKADTKRSKPVAPKAAGPMKATLVLAEVHKKLVSYNEVDAKGARTSTLTSGTLYYRQDAFPNGKFPKAIEITVRPIG